MPTWLDLICDFLGLSRWPRRRRLWTHQADVKLRREHLRSLPQSSWFLTRLPPEIRNQIYYLVFLPRLRTPSHIDHHQAVDLAACRPPPHALLQTCHQIYAEAIHIYHAKNTSFWTQTNFYIIGQHTYISLLSTISDHDLAQIRHLVIFGRYLTKHDRGRAYGWSSPAYRLLSGQRGWRAFYRTYRGWHTDVIEFDCEFGEHALLDVGVDVKDAFFERQSPVPLRKQFEALNNSYFAFAGE